LANRKWSALEEKMIRDSYTDAELREVAKKTGRSYEACAKKCAELEREVMQMWDFDLGYPPLPPLPQPLP